MALNIDVKFERKMTCAFKIDMRNLVNFHQSMFKSLKIGSLIQRKMYELKGYRGIMHHDNENWYKI